MKLALRSLKELVPDDSDHAPAIQGQRKRQENALKALQEALAQPQQEPVACKDCGAVIKDGVVKCVRGRSCWVGQQPAQRKPLTDAQIETVWRSVQANDFHDCVKPFARAIEAAHSIKENT